MQLVVSYSHRYTKEGMGAERFKSWRKITPEYLKAFLGFSILLGINVLLSLDDYWQRDQTLRYAPIADRNSRDRFQDISSYLYFRNNDTLELRSSASHDRIRMIRPLWCTKLYNPNKEVTVDEAMIKLQGQSSLKQYMPMNPVKRGNKVWVLGAAGLHGED